MDKVPFLSPGDFSAMSNGLHDVCSRSTVLDTAVRQEGDQCLLKIRCPLERLRDDDATTATTTTTAVAAAATEEPGVAESIEDFDEAAINRPQRTPGATVEYDVLLSPSYRVPVLYFRLLRLPASGPSGIDAVYEYLVPTHLKPQMQNVGVMGAISITNHPITDAICFFVHPCNIANAMREIIGGRKVSGLQYLQMWFGLIGPSVGLYLPRELAVRNEEPYRS